MANECTHLTSRGKCGVSSSISIFDGRVDFETGACLVDHDNNPELACNYYRREIHIDLPTRYNIPKISRLNLERGVMEDLGEGEMDDLGKNEVTHYDVFKSIYDTFKFIIRTILSK